jgi:hypothetical protein
VRHNYLLEAVLRRHETTYPGAVPVECLSMSPPAPAMANDRRKMPGLATTVKLLVMLGRLHHKRRDDREEKCDTVTDTPALPQNEQPKSTPTTTTTAITVASKAANERRQSSTSSSGAQLALSISTSPPSSMSSQVLPLSEGELFHSSSSGVSPCPP